MRAAVTALDEHENLSRGTAMKKRRTDYTPAAITGRILGVFVRDLTPKSFTKRTLEPRGIFEKPYKTRGFDGGRTRDRTLDLSRVKGTLSR
jgi:hypothetical protein